MIMKYKHCRLCCVKNITIIVILSSIFNNNRSKSNRYIRIFFFKKLENRKLWRKSREKKKVNFIVDEYDGETLSNDETIKTMIVIMMLMKKHIHMKKTENCMFCMS